MTAPWIILDTSYLLEAYRVPAYFENDAHTRVVEKLKEAVDGGYRIYVPAPVVFEMANHIADVKHAASRIAIAKKFAGVVAQAVQHQTPWIITPLRDPDILSELRTSLNLLEQFAEVYVAEGIGLTDVAIIHHAEQLLGAASKMPAPRPRIHIWTRHNTLKAREPDAEPDAFT